MSSDGSDGSGRIGRIENRETMSVGQIEKRTQARVVKLFRETLGYDYLGDWTDREDNRNIEPELLRTLLRKQGHDESLIAQSAVPCSNKAAGDTSKSLYDRNRDVYGLLRYGVKVKPDVGENTETVWLIDWEHPEQQPLRHRRGGHGHAADAKATASARTSCSTSTASRSACWS